LGLSQTSAPTAADFNVMSKELRINRRIRVQYRVAGERVACEDLAAAISYIFKNKGGRKGGRCF
jgi:hypothetical protein